MIIMQDAPVISTFFILLNTVASLFTYIELRLVQGIVRNVFSKEKEGFLVCFIGLLFCYIIQNLKPDLQQILQDAIQKRVLDKEYSKIYYAVGNMEITELDNVSCLLDIQQAKYAIENKVVESFICMCDMVGIVLNLLAIAGSLIQIQFQFLLCFVFMAVLQAIYIYYNSIDKSKLEKNLNLLYRTHKYYLDLFINKEMNMEIRSYKLYKWFEKKRDKVYEDIREKQLKQIKRWIGINGIVALLMYACEFAIYLFAVLQYGNKGITIDQIVFVLESNIVFIGCLIQFLDDSGNIVVNNVYLESFNKIKNIRRKKDQLLPSTHVGKAVQLQNVDYSYENKKEVLKNINIEIKKGEKIALLGENGSGKSTLVKIMVGLLEPDSGSICINGRQSIVFQDFAKFKFTMKENVFFGDLEEKDNEEKMIDSLGIVGIGKILENLPNGLQTELSKEFSSEGVELSGGEWQKLAISRGVFRNAEVIVLDEPTAALDPIAEEKQLEALDSIFKDKSVIIVSHRVGIAKKVDRILFLKDGKIIEDGSFEKLMENKRDFFEFYKMQSKWYH